MYGDPREAAELTILARLTALTTADGLPETFRLVTRELIHLADIKPAQLPACLLQMEEPEVSPALSNIVDVTLPGRLVVAFALSTVLPASSANAYRLTLERMLMADKRLGGLVDNVALRGTLMPGLWEGTQLLGLGVLFAIHYEYNPANPAVTV